MSARVSPYLSFAGNAREAMEFYQSVFGGSLEINTFADLRQSTDESQDELVGHAVLKGTTGIVLMGSDRNTGDRRRQRFLDCARR
ncbi:hypothetical protein [Micromonospora sp. NPDC005413]|uniref:hypothetical protein n=1 Tax=Micromonospora sp. NPDC005413 TaxID=3154563 RepID=UPI0033A8487C